MYPRSLYTEPWVEIAGGAGYALTGGNKRVADTIWRSSLGSDYVITPNMITGNQPVHFSGPTSMPPAASSDMATRVNLRWTVSNTTSND
jgi:hypothetical protein